MEHFLELQRKEGLRSKRENLYCPACEVIVELIARRIVFILKFILREG